MSFGGGGVAGAGAALVVAAVRGVINVCKMKLMLIK